MPDSHKQNKDLNHPGRTNRSLSNASNLTSLCVDISPSCSNFFEVLYIGKTKGYHKEVPSTYIDDALEKLKTQELKNQSEHTRSTYVKSEEDIGIKEVQVQEVSSHQHSLHRQLSYDDSRQTETESKERDEKLFATENSKNQDGSATDIQPSSDVADHNRTMVLQVGRTDLRLISPDRKIILLHKNHKDVITCVQGQTNSKYFGFICKEENNADTFIGYIFKCESPSIAADAVAAIIQAFSSADARRRQIITSCEHCPMVWFQKLCSEVENLPDKKAQAAILKRLDQLDDDEQNIVLIKFKGVETDSVRDQNEFLMAILRAHCEMKQGRHIHDTVENRSEFLSQHLGGSTIFTKAKRSLSNSFDHFLKRKASQNDLETSVRGFNLGSSLNREHSPHSPSPGTTSETNDRHKDNSRSRSSSYGSQPDYLKSKDNKCDTVSPEPSTAQDDGFKSPKLDIFLKVGTTHKSMSSTSESENAQDVGSWRQALFKKVATTKHEEKDQPSKKRTRDELRYLWKKSIRQTVLLIRMEKENARFKVREELPAIKRIKLEYDEMKSNEREVVEMWDLLTSKERSRLKCDNKMLLHAMRQGVPRGKRGEVWLFLAQQYCAKIAPMDTTKYPNYNVPYETLLKQLTSHHHAHAILIDLGRTFPNHSYFMNSLGPGQLALFNLLKAYSLLDPEVGYCQGLSFVAGVLLLHMNEQQAFFLLRHLMFRRSMRYQYLPDMQNLQVKLYQLSRLLHDELPDLYQCFNNHEVTPALYAAPWILTVFASQFPLGFVTRVFDLIFFEGADVIFRVALALLSFHKEKLLHCDSFEDIMNYLKEELPNIDKQILEKIMKQVYNTDISKRLNEYRVEYQVLQEEMSSVQSQLENLQVLNSQNQILTEQNKSLRNQLETAAANVQRLEKTRVLQQSQLNRLEMQNRTLNVTIGMLGNFLNELVEKKLDMEIPDDIRRILSQMSSSEQHLDKSKDQRNTNILLNHDSADKIMVKSLSTGKMDVSEIDRKEFRTNSLNSQTALHSNLKAQLEKSPNNSTERISKFFSNSHNAILQQKLNSHSHTTSNPKIDINVEEVDINTTIDKSASFPLQRNKIDNKRTSPSNSIESDVSALGSSPKSEFHPLGNCDVSFTYNGTRELKNIKRGWMSFGSTGLDSSLK